MSRKKQKKNKISRKNESLVAHFHLYYRIREASLLLTVALALFLLIALFSYHRNDPSWSHLVSDNHVANAGGRIGAWLSDFLLYIFGYGAYLFPMLLTYAAWIYYQHRHREHDESVHVWVMLTVRFIGFVLILLTFAALLALYVSTPITALPYNAGGILGALIGNGLWQAFGIPGATLMLITIFLIGFTLFTGISWLKTSEKTGVMVVRYLAVACRLIKKIPWLHFFRRNRAPSFDDPFDKPRPNVRQEEPMRAAQQEALPLTKPRIVRHKTADLELDTETLHRAPHFTASDIIPELTLLDPPPEAHPLTYDDEQLAARSREVEMRLVDFGIKAKVVAVHPGPVVTRYELQLAAGTKVSKITALVKDLARSLSVISVRVVEVIPGKSVIGLELPNEHRQVVSLREVLATKVYQNARSPLTLALGKDIAGHPVVVDLAKMPHLLVAGTTGSGKSVSLNTMLLSLLYKASPSKLRLILIDPKMLELAVYEGIPHLLAPVVTDMKDAATALRWCVVEMERRYRLMAALGVRNILGYNQKVKEAKQRGAPLLDPLQDKESQSELEELPRIVVLADEFADMMVVVGKKVETLISRLAQKARAAGIHLIFATQRPSVDVITGLIKANIPTRIAFQVSSKIDSRTVLDQQGAEQLLGNGDMLYLPPGSGLPVRVHGAFVHDEEVHRVVEYLKEHGETNYIDNLLDESAGVDTSGFTQAALGDAEVDGEKDPLYDEAVDIVIKAQRVSISSIQRRFKIGYNRAARIVEAMEAAGVVSAMESNGNRDVLVPRSREE